MRVGYKICRTNGHQPITLQTSWTWHPTDLFGREKWRQNKTLEQIKQWMKKVSRAGVEGWKERYRECRERWVMIGKGWPLALILGIAHNSIDSFLNSISGSVFVMIDLRRAGES